MSCNALIVGINQYKNLQKLPLPATDATAIANALKKHDSFKISYFPEYVDENNQLVIDPTPTAPVTIKKLQDELTKFFTPNSTQIPTTALFYFAGHGALDSSGEGYLCAYNSHPEEGIYGFSLAMLLRLLEKSPIPEKIVWLDCCHSGALFNDEPKSQTGDYFFITASRDYEPAYEKIEGDHSVLTNALLRGLDCTNKSEITADELITFVKEALRGETQDPRTRAPNGRIVLIRNPQYQATALLPPVKSPTYEKGSLLINADFFAEQETKHAGNTDLKKVFYGGTKAVQWVGIVKQLDAPRQDYPAAKQAIIQSFDSENAVAALIKGDGGSGKSVLLRRLAHDLSANYRVYWLEDIETFLEGEWQYEINKQPADNSTQTVIFLEDWYQHIENSHLEKEAADLLNKVSRTKAVRLVIGDRFAKGNRKKDYAAYISKQKTFELSANENLSLLEIIFTQMPEWKEKITAEQIKKSANASLFQLLFIFQYAENMDGDIIAIYQRIFDSDCRALLEHPTSPEFWQGMAKALYFYAHLYANEGVILSLDFLRDLAAYLADCAIPNRCTIEMLANDKLLKKYFGLDIAHSKFYGEILNFRFHHDTMADKGWMWVDVAEEYNDTLLQAVIQHFQVDYPLLMSRFYYRQMKQGGEKGKTAARAFLKTDKPWENNQAFPTCLTLLKDEAKDAARAFLKTDKPWELPEAFSPCLTLLKDEAKDAARAFLQTDKPWEYEVALSNCLNFLKDEPVAKEKARAFLQTKEPWKNNNAFPACLTLLKDEAKDAARAFLQTKEPWKNSSSFPACLTLLKDEAKDAARAFLQTKEPWKNSSSFPACLTLLKDEAKDAARAFLQTKEPWKNNTAFPTCLTLLKDEAKGAAKKFLKTDKPWEIKEAFSNSLSLLKDEPEGIKKAVYILENRDKFKAHHHWSLLYRSLETLCDKPIHQKLVTVVANEIIANKNSQANQYRQLLKLPLFYVTQWKQDTDYYIRNWKKIKQNQPKKPIVDRNNLYSVTIGYRKTPKLLENMCVGIVRNWQFELRVEQPHQAYFIRCLAYPAIQQNPKLRSEVIAICQTILKDNHEPPLMIKDGTWSWLQNIVENNQFPEWDSDD